MTVNLPTLAEVRTGRVGCTVEVSASDRWAGDTGAYRLGRRFGAQSLRVDVEIVAWLAEADALVAAAADPAVQADGRQFLDGVRDVLAGVS